MDKYEYKIRAEEIKNLVASKKYTEAMEVADTIDWHRVKSIMMLTIVSDIYKVNRRYEDSKAVLLLAYDRHPGGRTIVYSLCELAIKMEEFVQAWEYYKEFMQIAPKDTGRYVLQYKLYEAQEVSIEERISVLEEFKKKDYREKWAYELAYLYHRIGLSTKCVEECDELILWFGEGKYVLKAMELKMLHEPLTPSQQEKYDSFSGGKRGLYASRVEPEDDEMDNIQVKPMDVSKYNTMNLQKALADSMKEIFEDETESPDEDAGEEPREKAASSTVEAVIAPLLQETAEMPVISQTVLEKPVEKEVQEVFFEEERPLEMNLPEVEELEEIEEIPDTEENMESAEPAAGVETPPIHKKTPEELEYERMVAQEYDGQIKLVIPEEEKVEKQITGQMDIQDILAEWENTKKKYQEKRAEDVRKRVSEQTGQLFSEFDEATKTDLLAKLEAASLGEKVEEEDIVPAVNAEKSIPETLAEPEKETAPEEIEAKIAKATEAEAEPEEPKEVKAQPEESEEIKEEIKAEITEPEIIESEPEKSELTGKERPLTEEEEKLFSSAIHSNRARKEIVRALDKVTLDPYSGNVILTGEEGTGTLEFAKNFMKDIQLMDHNFSGKVAKISGRVLNTKDPAKIFEKLENGGLIVQRAGSLSNETVNRILKALEERQKGIIVLLEDTPKRMEKLLMKNTKLDSVFNAKIKLPQLNNDSLVNYAKQYAQDQEFSIDELGILALYTRIADMQTSDHMVNIRDVEDIMEDAMYHATKKSLSHLKDVIFGKRYDDEDMIILREKDFMRE